MILDLNTKVKDYTIVELLHYDNGGYREVYKAMEGGNTPVVLIAYAKDMMRDEAQKTLPEHEIDLHANLMSDVFLPMRDTGETEGRNHMTVQYCVLDYWEINSLAYEISKGLMKTQDAWSIFKDIIIGLNEIAHYAKGAWHCNICPETIYVRREEDGTARAVLGGLQYVTNDTAENKPVDTRLLSSCFRAPETNLDAHSPKSMQFSLAVLLTYMLQGKHPWRVRFERGSYYSFTMMRRNKPQFELPVELTKCLKKALSIDPSGRYDTMDDFVTEVMKFSHMELPATYECFGSAKTEQPSQPALDEDAAKTVEEAPAGFEEYKKQLNESGTEPKTTVKMKAKKGAGFNAVAGMESLLTDLRRDFIDVVNNREMAKQYGINIPNMLFYGPPGVGKTYIAERLSEELGIDYSLVTPSDLGSIYIHGSQSLIRQLFDKARKQAARNKRGVLLVFDEMEAVCPTRTPENRDNQAGEVAEMLVQLNRCTEDNVFCIGTTNCIDRIDKAILRKGRLDKVIFFNLPDTEARQALFKYELSSRPHAENINIEHLSNLTEGFSSSDITYIVCESARQAFATAIHSETKDVVKIEQPLIEEVIAKTRPSVSKSDMKRYERMRDEFADGNKQERRAIGFLPA